MRVLIVEPGKNPEVREIRNELEDLQQVVGGYIECPTLRDAGERQIVLICNEEGKLMNLPMNTVVPELHDMIFGTFLIAAAEGEDFASLTEEEVKEWSERFSLPEETE